MIDQQAIKIWEKNIREKLKKYKNVSGYYRIFIKDPQTNKELNYIGLSNNLYIRIKTHFSNIKLYYLLQDDKRKSLIFASIKARVVPANDAFYFKTTLFCYEKKLNFTNFNFEILETTELNKKNPETSKKIYLKEMDYIKKFNSEKYGFNGPHTKVQSFLSWISQNDIKTIKNNKTKWLKFQIDLELMEKQENINQKNRIDYMQYINDEKAIAQETVMWNWYGLFFDSKIEKQKTIANKIFNAWIIKLEKIILFKKY